MKTRRPVAAGGLSTSSGRSARQTQRLHAHPSGRTNIGSGDHANVTFGRERPRGPAPSRARPAPSTGATVGNPPRRTSVALRAHRAAQVSREQNKATTASDRSQWISSSSCLTYVRNMDLKQMAASRPVPSWRWRRVRSPRRRDSSGWPRPCAWQSDNRSCPTWMLPSTIGWQELWPWTWGRQGMQPRGASAPPASLARRWLLSRCENLGRSTVWTKKAPRCRSVLVIAAWSSVARIALLRGMMRN